MFFMINQQYQNLKETYLIQKLAQNGTLSSLFVLQLHLLYISVFQPQPRYEEKPLLQDEMSSNYDSTSTTATRYVIQPLY